MTKRIELLDLIEKLQSMTEQGAIEWSEVDRTNIDPYFTFTIGNVGYFLDSYCFWIRKVEPDEYLASYFPSDLPKDVAEKMAQFYLYVKLWIHSNKTFKGLPSLWKQLDNHEKDFLATKAPEQIED
jgi:hypothetical protein